MSAGIYNESGELTEHYRPVEAEVIESEIMDGGKALATRYGYPLNIF